MRRFGLLFTVALFLLTGIMHFAATKACMEIVPPYIPKPKAAVYISGVAEMAGALGLLVCRTRRGAGWSLVALLVAVFPANVFMATNHVQITEQPIPDWALWARLLLQPLLIWLVIWVKNEDPA